MAEVDPKVMKYVENALKRNPGLENKELFDRVKKAHPSMKKLGSRQFNARYPLQVKRRRALAEGGRSGPGKKRSPAGSGPRSRTQIKPETPRDTVRQVFLDFATDLAAAEERKDLVRVVADVDTYVDQVIKGLAKG